MSSIKEPCDLPPVAAFARLRRLPCCCWLDSGPGFSPSQRVSILAAEPSLILRAWGNRIEKIRDGSTLVEIGDGLAALESILQTRRIPSLASPFSGGGIGYFSYEFGCRLAGQADCSSRPPHWPDFQFHFFDAVYCFDHETGRATLQGGNDERGKQALHRLAKRLFAQPTTDERPEPASPSFVANRDRADYLAAVAAIREHIAAGDIYQANLAQFFSTPHSGDPAALYLELRERNPAPYSAWLDLGSRQILSSSPELFLQVTPDRRILTRPIKGTRPRSSDPLDDRHQREQLLASAKERAELLMIVDMERNDLGRIAAFGSVRVNELYKVESFATVHHLIGEIEARLRPGVGLPDILRATFPGGSITVAPKLKAMEIIAQLEPSLRGVFCGSIGWLGDDGSIALNIAIRTITCQENRAEFGVGAGIVWDSQPEAEYAETLHKAAALFHALGRK